MAGPLARLWPESDPDDGLSAVVTLEDLVEDPRRVQVGPKPVALKLPPFSVPPDDAA